MSGVSPGKEALGRKEQPYLPALYIGLRSSGKSRLVHCTKMAAKSLHARQLPQCRLPFLDRLSRRNGVYFHPLDESHLRY